MFHFEQLAAGVEQAENYSFSMDGNIRGDSKVDGSAFVVKNDAPILMPPSFGNVGFGENFHAVGESRGHIDGQFSMIYQHSVLAEPDSQPVLLGFKVDIGGVRFHRIIQNLIDRLNNGTFNQSNCRLRYGCRHADLRTTGFEIIKTHYRTSFHFLDMRNGRHGTSAAISKTAWSLGKSAVESHFSCGRLFERIPIRDCCLSAAAVTHRRCSLSKAVTEKDVRILKWIRNISSAVHGECGYRSCV